ncbi:MAG: hypothetical protein WBD22_03830 [Pyrinomonadaceae bacterium]
MKSKSRFYLAPLSFLCIASVVWAAPDVFRSIKNFAENAIFAQQSNNEQKGQLVDQHGNPSLMQENVYERVGKKVVRLGRTQDLMGLKGLENSINSSPLKDNIALYTELMIKICGAYNTYDFKDPRQYLHARECAKDALIRLDEMPIGRATKLVGNLGGDSEYLFQVVPEAKWRNDRTERAKYWFRAWQLLERASIQGYDFENNRPVCSSKMSVAERVKAEEYNRQRFLQRDRETFLVDFRRFVVDAYSRPPFDMAELEDYLQQYVQAAELRISLVSDVRKKTSVPR